MADNLKQKILLVGAGQMATDYYNVLKDLKCDVMVVGRGENSAEKFYEKTGFKPFVGGLTKFLTLNENNFSKAIVAVGIDALKRTAIELINNNYNSILVEKPAGLNFQEIIDLANYSKLKGADVFVAYNRRYYSSVQKAKEIIEEDGGVTSFHFEFTEWAQVIEKLVKPPCVKENWFLGNSTHVVDLAFYLGGKPAQISCFTAGGLEWHPKASVFTGAGITENGALFSYHANWEAPGRWGVEVLTKKHRLILRPLEKLQLQNIGSINIEVVDLEDELDKKFKPGLYCLTKSFIENSLPSPPTIFEHKNNCKYYERIIG